MKKPPLVLHIELVRRTMHQAAIVPHHQIVGAPFVFINQIRARRMAQEFVQQRVAFFHAHPFNMRSVIANIQSFPAGIGMCADEWVRDWRCFLQFFFRRRSRAGIYPGLRPTMHQAETI